MDLTGCWPCTINDRVLHAVASTTQRAIRRRTDAGAILLADSNAAALQGPCHTLRAIRDHRVPLPESPRRCANSSDKEYSPAFVDAITQVSSLQLNRPQSIDEFLQLME